MESVSSVVDQAGSQGGWVAALLVILVIAGFSSFGYVIRQTVLDLRELQSFVRGEMSNVIDDNTVCWARAANAFRTCPGFDSDVDRIADGNGTRTDDAAELDATAQRAIKRRQVRQSRRGPQGGA